MDTISLNMEPKDIARYIYEKYKREFKYSGNTWYHYINHRWVENEHGILLKNKIKDEKAVELSLQLCQTDFCNSVFTQCKELFFDTEFENNLDSKDNLLHFLNGIYDLDKNELREGYPEDNISLTTGINFIEQPNEKLEQVEDFMTKIFPQEHVKKYVLTLLASFLHGSNKNKKFHIWNGTGCNGKSSMINLYKKTIGDYGGSMSITALTNGLRGTENPSPVLASTRGKRFISIDDADDDYEIQVGFLKQLLSGDEITARPLYKNAITFRPQFKVVLQCNTLPKIPSADGGTWRRISLVKFVSRFCDNPQKDNEFQIDHELENKMNEWREAFMYMLIQYYRINDLQEPEEFRGPW